MSVEQWWSDAEREQEKWSEKNTFRCHFFPPQFTHRLGQIPKRASSLRDQWLLV
jgi:hypothetical protein